MNTNPHCPVPWLAAIPDLITLFNSVGLADLRFSLASCVWYINLSFSFKDVFKILEILSSDRTFSGRILLWRILRLLLMIINTWHAGLTQMYDSWHSHVHHSFYAKGSTLICTTVIVIDSDVIPLCIFTSTFFHYCNCFSYFIQQNIHSDIVITRTGPLDLFLSHLYKATYSRFLIFLRLPGCPTQLRHPAFWFRCWRLKIFGKRPDLSACYWTYPCREFEYSFLCLRHSCWTFPFSSLGSTLSLLHFSHLCFSIIFNFFSPAAWDIPLQPELTFVITSDAEG